MAPAILGAMERPGSPIFPIGQGGIFELKSKGQICQPYFLPKQNRKRKMVEMFIVPRKVVGRGLRYKGRLWGKVHGVNAGGEGEVHVINDQRAKEDHEI